MSRILIEITKLAHVEGVELIFPIEENRMLIIEIKERDRLCQQKQSIHEYLDLD